MFLQDSLATLWGSSINSENIEFSQACEVKITGLLNSRNRTPRLKNLTGYHHTPSTEWKCRNEE